MPPPCQPQSSTFYFKPSCQPCISPAPLNEKHPRCTMHAPTLITAPPHATTKSPPKYPKTASYHYRSHLPPQRILAPKTKTLPTFHLHHASLYLVKRHHKCHQTSSPSILNLQTAPQGLHFHHFMTRLAPHHTSRVCNPSSCTSSRQRPWLPPSAPSHRELPRASMPPKIVKNSPSNQNTPNEAVSSYPCTFAPPREPPTEAFETASPPCIHAHHPPTNQTSILSPCLTVAPQLCLLVSPYNHQVPQTTRKP